MQIEKSSYLHIKKKKTKNERQHRIKKIIFSHFTIFFAREKSKKLQKNENKNKLKGKKRILKKSFRAKMHKNERKI